MCSASAIYNSPYTVSLQCPSDSQDELLPRFSKHISGGKATNDDSKGANGLYFFYVTVLLVF